MGPDGMFIQLTPPIPLQVLERGDGFAVGVIDYGQEHNLIWVTAINDTGEIYHQVRLKKTLDDGSKSAEVPDGCVVSTGRGPRGKSKGERTVVLR